jgi:hypothetical protein
MTKTISFKPAVRPVTTPDDWIRGGREASGTAPAKGETMKRFTIDVPLELHRRVKAACAQRGLKMADVLRELLEREFPAA